MDYIKLKENKNVYRLGIIDEQGNVVKDENGVETCIEFDLSDIEIPLKYNRCIKSVEKAKNDLKMQFLLIDKKQDYRKNERVLSVNEEAKAKAMKKFYEEMEKSMDLFLGEGGTKKFLNGRKPYWEMFEDLSEAIEPYLPNLKTTMNDMVSGIKKKYSLEETDVIEND